jgi:hypothetical protein
VRKEERREKKEEGREKNEGAGEAAADERYVEWGN